MMHIHAMYGFQEMPSSWKNIWTVQNITNNFNHSVAMQDDRCNSLSIVSCVGKQKVCKAVLQQLPFINTLNVFDAAVKNNEGQRFKMH